MAGHQKVRVRHGAIVLVHCNSSPGQKKWATIKIEKKGLPSNMKKVATTKIEKKKSATKIEKGVTTKIEITNWTEWRVERGRSLVTISSGAL